MPIFENCNCISESLTTCLKRDAIANQYSDLELLFLDPVDYDEAIIGVVEGFGGLLTVAYDFDKVIKINMKLLNTDYEGAVEWYEYNQLGSYVGEHTPMYIHNYFTGEIE